MAPCSIMLGIVLSHAALVGDRVATVNVDAWYCSFLIDV